MMNKKTYLLLAFTLCLLAFAFTSGCGQYVAQYSAPAIIERYPALNADGVGSTEILWIRFSKSMDTSGTGINEISNKIKSAIDMTATATFYPSPTPEIIWSDNDTKLTLANFFFIANPGNRVHFQASLEALQDTNGKFITENADLLNYTLAGLSVTDRYPTVDATISNVAVTIVATFDNPVNTGTFVAGMGSGHTAGESIPFPPVYTWSNFDTTLSVENVSWEGTSGSVVDITYEAEDIYGNVVTNGQLFKYNLQ